ncbi:hypothetical protein DFH28DRAFT_927511 [Melampsora americana]|nr:hypothetical protein DFH28DRAFT_927511 [Melampsora americana]
MDGVAPSLGSSVHTESVRKVKVPQVENGDGSNGKSMAEIQSLYSQILPYNKPNWYRNWSKFASDLIKSDEEHNRPIHQNEGPTPTRPVRSDDKPVFIFDISSNPTYPDDIDLEKSVEKSNKGKS